MTTFNSILLLVEKGVSKLLRPILKNTFHKRFISDDFFEQLCTQINRETGKTSALFLVSDELEERLDQISLDRDMKVVLIGKSDRDFTEPEISILRSIKKTTFFVQNLNVAESSNIKLLPIGIEGMRWAKNGLSFAFRKPFIRKVEQKHDLLVGPFRLTHTERKELLAVAARYKAGRIIDEALPSVIYDRVATKYRFVACPRGNGLDTHRFWETLYRGCVPVLIESHWSRTLRGYGLPIVELSAWADLAAFDAKNIEIALQDSSFLKTSWWASRLRTLANRASF